jgi:hypothetical protein
MGSGSGGGVFVKCWRFSGSDTALVRANGGVGGPNGHGGGGGRIAIWRRHHLFSGTVTVDGGYGSDPSQNPGEAGTIVWVDLVPAGTLVVVR